MERVERITNLYLLVLLPAGIAAVVWAVLGFPIDRVDSGLIGIAVTAIFLGSFLRIQIPRTKVHLTISDALIIFSLIYYGGEISILLAVLESAFTSMSFHRQGILVRQKTALINFSIAAISVYIASQAAEFIFGPINFLLARNDNNSLAWLLSVVAFSLFFTNSIGVAIFAAIRNSRSVWKTWQDYSLNALFIYLSGALVAGILIKAFEQINLLLIAAITGFSVLVYLTYRKYVKDIKETAAKTELAERARAEQAEAHVLELQHYVSELEKSGEALRASREKFRHAAFHDALTGLPNRNHFIDTLKKLLQKSRQNPAREFAVLFLDLNRFKTINDSLGHSVGDTLILSVAERLAHLMSGGEQVGRFSGDEFTIVLPTIESVNTATEFAEKVTKLIAEPFTVNNRQVFTSVSIGIVIGSHRYHEAEEILRDADIAMYYAKETQKDYMVFDQIMHIRAVTLHQLETELRYAIERNELELYYQPIIRLDDLRLTGFEALVRWNHPQRGVVPPSEFINLSENSGLIVPMTLKILRSACNQLLAWQNQSPGENLSMSINLSSKHFARIDLCSQIKTVLEETGIDPSKLKLEITESAVMENAETAVPMLAQIKETGVRLSIDDFGTGYSSLSYLHRFPIDELKVDRGFVSTMEDGSENGEIVRTVIALAKVLKLSVVAEGIESIHQFHQLRVLGCELGQGFLFSRPLPAREIEKLLEDPMRWQNLFLPDRPPTIFHSDSEISHLRLEQ